MADQDTGQQGGTGDGASTGTGQGQQGGQDGGQAPPNGNTGQQNSGTGTGGQQAGQAGADGDVSSLPEWAQKALRDARQEAGKARTTAKQNAADQARQDLAQEIGKALGLVQDDTPPDPAKLTQQLTSEREQRAAERVEHRTALVELAIYRQAAQHDANPAALADSRSFMTAVSGLDPAADGFAGKVADAIKKAVKDNPSLAGRAAPAARSGGEFPGSPAAPTNLEQQIADAEKNRDFATAIALKRQRAAQTQ